MDTPSSEVTSARPIRVDANVVIKHLRQQISDLSYQLAVLGAQLEQVQQELDEQRLQHQQRNGNDGRPPSR